VALHNARLINLKFDLYSCLLGLNSPFCVFIVVSKLDEDCCIASGIFYCMLCILSFLLRKYIQTSQLQCES